MRGHVLNTTKKTMEERDAINNTLFYDTKFNFLKQHNGIRPNKFHLFIAPTGVGKSTLTRSLIYDMLEKNKDMRIFLYITEETIEDFETATCRFLGGFNQFGGRLEIGVEKKELTEEGVKEDIENYVFHNDYDLFIIDNITTSKIYLGKPPNIQDEAAMWLKGLLRDTTLFVIAHTNGNEYDKSLMDESHVRGSKSITNLVEFLYILQPIRLNDSLYQFVRIIKSRNQEPLNKFFKLIYNSKERSIDRDSPRNFEEFKMLFKQRNTL